MRLLSLGSLIFCGLVLLLTTTVYTTQIPTAPTAPTWPTQWHADVIVGDAGYIPNSKDLSVLYQGSYLYNYNSSSSPILSYFLTHRYSSRVEKEVIFSNGGNELTPYVIDYSTGQCSSPVLIKDRWRVWSPRFISDNGFQFVAYDYLLTTEGDSYIETTHWRYSPLIGTTVDYWHSTGTNSPFRFIWTPVTGNPVVIQFSNFVLGFQDIANPNFYFSISQNCNSDLQKISNKLINKEIISEQSGQPGSFLASNKRANANPWPVQWNAPARFTGNVFGQQSLLPTTIPFSLSGHFYYDYVNLRECNVWTDLSSGARTKTLIVNGTFYVVALSTGMCFTVPIAPVSGPLKPEWPTTVPQVGQEWLYVKDTRAFISSEHYRSDALNIGEKYAFNYWQSSNGTPRLFQGPVQGTPPYGVSLMEWEGVELGLMGVDVNNVFSTPKVCRPVATAEQLKAGTGLNWVEGLVQYHIMTHKVLS